jgi:uncharacterized iron-regulated protein
MRRLIPALVLLILAGCAAPAATPGIEARVTALLPADIILLGEQHDAPEHQFIQREVIESLQARGLLGAVALEMAPQGGSTLGLPATATEAAVQAALNWQDEAWLWANYAPPVMAAVRAGVPVLGANLPRTAMRAAMGNAQLDALLPAAALQAQQEAIREGHCGLLPASQVAPMARIQIARDQAMAQTLTNLVTPGKTVVLLAGAGHVDRGLGVPLHLKAGITAKSVALRPASSVNGERSADATWNTPAVAPKDYCAELRRNPPGPMSPGPARAPPLTSAQVAGGGKVLT